MYKLPDKKVPEKVMQAVSAEELLVFIVPGSSCQADGYSTQQNSLPSWELRWSYTVHWYSV